MFHFLKSDMKTQSAVFHFLNFKSKLSVIFAQCIHKISQNINLCLYLINADWNKGIRKISKKLHRLLLLLTDSWSVWWSALQMIFPHRQLILNLISRAASSPIMEGQTWTISLCFGHCQTWYLSKLLPDQSFWGWYFTQKRVNRNHYKFATKRHKCFEMQNITQKFTQYV